MSSRGGERVIYIIDDDAAVREGLCRLARSAGFEARPFVTSDQFLAEVQSPAPGCILLDITTTAPGNSRLQGALLQRGLQLPLIAISARDDAATRRKARELGSRFFMGKPIDDQALLDAIEWVIESGRNGTTG
jgi:FixJ family two-component response regulator